MTEFCDVMIDLETMGCGADAAILSIGAVAFNLQTLTKGTTFYRTVNLATSVKRGGTMDPGTVVWWLGQSEEARRAVRQNTYPEGAALEDFTRFCNALCPSADLRPWGNSVSFDVTILGSAYARHKLDAPWRWWNERCFRTIRAQFPSVEPDERQGVHHNALDDAMSQVLHLFKIKETMRARAAQTPQAA